MIERGSPESISAAQIQLRLVPLLHLLGKIGEEAVAAGGSFPGAKFANWVAQGISYQIFTDLDHVGERHRHDAVRVSQFI